MTGFYVRWGADVDPYVRCLASEHINTLSAYCDGVAKRVIRTRARKRGVVTITRRVECGMIDGAAQHKFRKFGFHFQLRETPNQPANVKKREFVLNFATPPKFAPEDMPLRLRKRPGREPSARPAKGRRRPRAAARASAWLRKRTQRQLYKFHKLAEGAGVTGVAVVSRIARSVWEMAVKLGIHMQMLRKEVSKLWRRRPYVSFAPRCLNQVLTRMREPFAYAPVRAWLESRSFGERIGLPSLLLNVLASNEPPIDWDAFPFGEPPEESERLRV